MIFLGDVRFSHCWCWGFRPSGMWYCVSELVVFNLPLKYASLTQWHSITSQKTQLFIILWLSFFPPPPFGGWWFQIWDKYVGRAIRLVHTVPSTFCTTACLLYSPAPCVLFFNMLALEKYFFIKIRYTFVQFLCFDFMSYLSSWLHAVELCKVRQCCACCWNVLAYYLAK